MFDFDLKFSYSYFLKSLSPMMQKTLLAATFKGYNAENGSYIEFKPDGTKIILNCVDKPVVTIYSLQYKETGASKSDITMTFGYKSVKHQHTIKNYKSVTSDIQINFIDNTGDIKFTADSCQVTDHIIDNDPNHVEHEIVPLGDM